MCAPAARGRGRESGEQRSGEGRGHRAERGRRERDSIADGTALRCGRVGSRHFQKLDIERYRASLFVLPTILIHVAARIYDVFIEII